MAMTSPALVTYRLFWALRFWKKFHNKEIVHIMYWSTTLSGPAAAFIIKALQNLHFVLLQEVSCGRGPWGTRDQFLYHLIPFLPFLVLPMARLKFISNITLLHCRQQHGDEKEGIWFYVALCFRIFAVITMVIILEPVEDLIRYWNNAPTCSVR